MVRISVGNVVARVPQWEADMFKGRNTGCTCIGMLDMITNISMRTTCLSNISYAIDIGYYNGKNVRLEYDDIDARDHDYLKLLEEIENVERIRLETYKSGGEWVFPT